MPVNTTLEMNFPTDLRQRLESALADTSGIIVPKGRREEEYFEGLRQSIKNSLAEPEWVTATVEEPGFAHRNLGDKVTGILLAASEGYWLVFEPNEEQYYCFWGKSKEDLGAFGVCGNPLYCWWE